MDMRAKRLVLHTATLILHHEEDESSKSGKGS